MRMFAKIFESEKYGQLVVMKDQNDDGDPCVKLYLDPRVDGIDITSSSIGCTSDEGRQLLFDKFTAELAEKIAGELMKAIAEICPSLIEEEE